MNAQAREVPTVSLPSREQIERAIAEWWSGGGTSRILVDVLRREGATVNEAKQLASRMAARAEATSYISGEVIGEQLEMLRAAAAWKKGRDVGPNTEFDTFKCLFGDGVQCVQCTKLLGEVVVHGRLAGMPV